MDVAVDSLSHFISQRGKMCACVGLGVLKSREKCKEAPVFS